jgi:hypothetical protein
MQQSLPSLSSLVEIAESSGEGAALGRLHGATRIAAELSDLGDRLLDHFVGAARAEGASWAEIGQVLGVSKQAAQQRFFDPAGGRSETWPEWVGEQARDAVAAAAGEARALRHNYIGTEHVLLGLVEERENLAAQALAMLGVTEENVRAQIRSIIGEGLGAPRSELGITPRTKRAFVRARQIAKRLEHSCVRSEHLLLALAEGDGVARQVLEALGAPVQAVREQIAQMLAVDAPELAAAVRQTRRRLPALRART